MSNDEITTDQVITKIREMLDCWDVEHNALVQIAAWYSDKSMVDLETLDKPGSGMISIAREALGIPETQSFQQWQTRKKNSYNDEESE